MREFRIKCDVPNGHLDQRSFDSRIAAELDPLRKEYRDNNSTIPDVDHFILDAANVKTADNYGCLAIVLLCEQLLDKFNADVSLNLPVCGEFANDFFSGGFRNPLSSIVLINERINELFHEHTSERKYHVVSSINSTDDIREMSNHVRDTFIKYLQTERSVLSKDIRTSLERMVPFLTIGMELSQNILDHSQIGKPTKPHGLISFRFLTSMIEIAVMDLGIGIPASLKMDSTSPDESIDAIKRACQEKISREKMGRGLGLFLTKRSVTKLNGELSITSGKANVIFNCSNEFKGDNVHSFYTPFFAGTQIQLRLPIKCPKKEVEHDVEVYQF